MTYVECSFGPQRKFHLIKGTHIGKNFYTIHILQDWQEHEYSTGGCAVWDTYDVYIHIVWDGLLGGVQDNDSKCYCSNIDRL